MLNKEKRTRSVLRVLMLQKMLKFLIEISDFDIGLFIFRKILHMDTKIKRDTKLGKRRLRIVQIQTFKLLMYKL